MRSSLGARSAVPSCRPRDVASRAAHATSRSSTPSPWRNTPTPCVDEIGPDDRFSVRYLHRAAHVEGSLYPARTESCRSAYDLVVTDFVSATADIRGDYRYSLMRAWNASQPTITFVLLNPSTADAVDLDPTLRRCVSFAERDGGSGA